MKICYWEKIPLFKLGEKFPEKCDAHTSSHLYLLKALFNLINENSIHIQEQMLSQTFMYAFVDLVPKIIGRLFFVLPEIADPMI
jgi:hypothetical protein